MFKQKILEINVIERVLDILTICRQPNKLWQELKNPSSYTEKSIHLNWIDQISK